MNVLLSIKPKYVKAIISGDKRYEFRKTIFKAENINYVYIYSSSPVKKIVASFKIGTIIEDNPTSLWENVKDHAGLSDKDFFQYFEGKTRGYAIEIKDFDEFKNPYDPWQKLSNFIPPQSYCYFDELAVG